MKLATWNVNSVRAREERLLRWLASARPDVVCLQELKVTDEAFPAETLRGAGYEAAVHGQKTYNGVGVLARRVPGDAERGFADGGDDSAARLIAVRLGPVHVVSAYVPNGGAVGSDKWAYKLEWLKRLRAWLDRRFARTDLVALCGDFNVAPEPRDVKNPEKWADSVLCHPQARAALEHVRQWGLVDAFRQHCPDPGYYSWWDYRMLGFQKDDGLRIDHVLLSEPLAERCRSASIERNERKGQQPSDHVPVVVELDVDSGEGA
jgi:exodeoxyribonuclease-3